MSSERGLLNWLKGKLKRLYFREIYLSPHIAGSGPKTCWLAPLPFQKHSIENGHNSVVSIRIIGSCRGLALVFKSQVQAQVQAGPFKFTHITWYDRSHMAQLSKNIMRCQIERATFDDAVGFKNASALFSDFIQCWGGLGVRL